MSGWENVGLVIGTLCFLIWVPCMISWMRRGVSIPRYIHTLSAGMTCVGVACLTALAAAGLITLKLAIAFVFLPAALTYFGWFWMFGPELST